MTETQSAWAIGLATFAGERMLDAWFPEPHLGAGRRARPSRAPARSRARRPAT